MHVNIIFFKIKFFFFFFKFKVEKSLTADYNDYIFITYKGLCKGVRMPGGPFHPSPSLWVWRRRRRSNGSQRLTADVIRHDVAGHAGVGLRKGRGGHCSIPSSSSRKSRPTLTASPQYTSALYIYIYMYTYRAVLHALAKRSVCFSSTVIFACSVLPSKSVLHARVHVRWRGDAYNDAVCSAVMMRCRAFSHTAVCRWCAAVIVRVSN